MHYGKRSEVWVVNWLPSLAGLRGSRGTSDLVKRDGKVSRHPPVRKLEFSLEDQIQQLFRRAKITQNGYD